MNESQLQFTTEELNLRLECLKIAAIHYKNEKEMCFIARNIYYWLKTDGDPDCFYDEVNDPNGILWEGAIPASMLNPNLEKVQLNQLKDNGK